MPTRDDAKALVAAMKNASDVEYALSRLNSPDWLPFLEDEGIFLAPYEPIKEEQGIAFPAWGPSRLLARLAAAQQPDSVQDRIVSIAIKIPQTENFRVHDDLAEVALAVRPEKAAKMISAAIAWIRSPHSHFLCRKLGALASHLANGGQVAPALKLLNAVLEIKEDPQSAAKSDRSEWANTLEPTAHCDQWEYEQIIQAHLPAVVDVAPMEALRMICDCLDRAIVYSNRAGESRCPWDLSYIWRPAVEESTQNLRLGLKHVLVTGVRDVAERALESGKIGHDEILNELEVRSSRWVIFRRLALHLLWRHPDLFQASIRNMLLDRAVFESLDLRHELYLLQQKCFGGLKIEGQNTILEWINEGVSEESIAQWERFIEKALSTDERRRLIENWQRDRLEPIKEFLDESWRTRYDHLVSSLGPAQHPEFISFTQAGARGTKSPLSDQELEQMSPQDLIGYLRSWNPPSGPGIALMEGASPEGLARVVRMLVGRNPTAYIDEPVESLSEPTYVRAIVEGLHEALRKDRAFDWKRALGLCIWTSRHERNIEGRVVAHFDRDESWGAARMAVARFITDAVESESSQIPLELSDQVWAALAPILRDPDPSEDHERRYILGASSAEDAGSGLKFNGVDPYTSAINSVRGTAVESAIRFALWIRNQGDDENLQPRLREFKAALENHLNPTREPSISVRAVIGRWIPQLQYIDRAWMLPNISKVFSRNDLLRWHAAWDAYVAFCPAYREVLGILKDEYKFALDQIGRHDHPWKIQGGQDEALIQHVIDYYALGALDLNDDLIVGLFEKATAPLRGYALSWVGRGMLNAEKPIDPEIQRRLKSLFDWRLDAARGGDAGEELKQFGWWFASRKLDPEWSVKRLLATLDIAQSITPGLQVVESLESIAADRPLEAVRALAVIAAADRKGWEISTWRSSAQRILNCALRSPVPDAQATARRLIDDLGARGFFEFGRLLRDSDA